MRMHAQNSLRPPRCVPPTGPVVVRLAGMAIERERERECMRAGAQKQKKLKLRVDAQCVCRGWCWDSEHNL
jgi:hypothetical protein